MPPESLRCLSLGVCSLLLFLYFLLFLDFLRSESFFFFFLQRGTRFAGLRLLLLDDGYLFLDLGGFVFLKEFPRGKGVVRLDAGYELEA